MNPDTRALDQKIRDWWLDGSEERRFSSILDVALSGDVHSVVPLARALSIIDCAELAPSLTSRVDGARGHLCHLIERSHQVDALGDIENEPETVFAILGDEVGSLTGYDPDKLRQSRLAHQGSKASAGEALLDALNWSSVTGQSKTDLELAIEDLKDRERYEAWGLFVDSDRTEGIALGLKFSLRDDGQEITDIDRQEIRQQARFVASHFARSPGWQMSVEWPAAFTGESIGLPLSIAAMTARGQIPRDALLASTGRIDVSGNVLAVAGIKEKLRAARAVGMRRVVVPRENAAEAQAEAGGVISVISVAHLDELNSVLRQPLNAIEFDFAALTRLVRASAGEYGLLLLEEREHPHGRCFVVGNTAGRVQLWVYTNGRVMAQGGAGKPLEAAQRLIRERVPKDPEPRTTTTFDSLTEAYQRTCQSALEQIGGRHEEPHAHESARIRLVRGRSSATVVLYQSGKCVLQGSAPAWQSAFDVLSSVLSPIGGLNTPALPGASAPETAPDAATPHIGTDEAGRATILAR